MIEGPEIGVPLARTELDFQSEKGIPIQRYSRPRCRARFQVQRPSKNWVTLLLVAGRTSMVFH